MKEIWGPMYSHSTCEPLSDVLISEAETRFNAKFPKSYLDLLEIRNGGFLKCTRHPKTDVEVDRILGIGHSAESIFDTDWDYYAYDENGVEKPFPNESEKLIQLSGDGHSYICLDYRDVSDGMSNPKITYIDTELSFEIPLSESFEELISSLEYTSPYFEYLLFSSESEDEILVSSIERCLPTKLEDLRESPGFFCFRGKVVSSDYRVVVDQVNPNFRHIYGDFASVWLKYNDSGDGYFFYPEFKGARWLLQIGESVQKFADIESRLKQAGISYKLVHQPK